VAKTPSTASATRPNIGLVHEAFREVVRRQGEAPAVVDATASMTYKCLDVFSDQMATRLQSAGVRSGDHVPLLLPRSPSLIVTMLAVLKCGAAYACLEPTWPENRIRSVLNRLRGRLVIVGPNEMLLPGAHGLTWEVPPIASLSSVVAAPQQLPKGLSNGSIATIFFTSGSTGEPKGALSPHAATTRLFGQTAIAGLNRKTVIAQGSALPWDGLTLEVWGALLTGGTCVLSPGALSPDVLRLMIRESGVNTVWLTASLFNLAVDEDIEAFCGLRLVMTGGERLSASHVERFLVRHGDDVRLVNGYGPVENTVFATTHVVRRSDLRGDIPLGRATPGTEVHVVVTGNPAPVGVVGEIWLSGEGLAKGYLHDNVATRRAFIHTDLGRGPVRIYRTGDLGWFDHEGLLRFQGRNDRQVKISGVRIEPVEIERAVTGHRGVQRAVVLLQSDATGSGTRLICFFTSSDAIEIASLAEHVRRELPAAMVPTTWCPVERMPLTANGKLDTEALLASPAISQGQDGRGTLEGDDQRAIAQDFEALLGVPWTDPDASLFSAGSSLDGLRLVARVARRTGVVLPMADFLRHPTVAGLAELLRRTPPMVPSVASYAEVALLPGQRDLWVASSLDPASRSNVCPMSWQVQLLDKRVLVAAMQDVHARHPALRAEYRIELGPGTREPERSTAPEIAILNEPQTFASLSELLTRPLDPRSGRSWRAVLAPEQGSDKHLLGLGVHHVAFDGWSEHLLCSDLSVALDSRAKNRAPAYQEPAPHLAQVAAAHHASQGDVGDGAECFWAAVLQEAPEPVLLPLTEGAGSGERAIVSGAFHVMPSSLAALQRKHGPVRPSVLWLASFAQALASSTGRSEFLVAMPVARRGHAVLAAAVTCLIEMVPLRLRPNSTSFPATVSQCETVLNAALEQRLPSVRALTKLAGVRGRPLYDVVLALHDRPRATLTAECRGAARRHPADPGRGRPRVAEVWPAEQGFTCHVHYPEGMAGIPLLGDVLDRWASPFAAAPTSKRLTADPS